MSELNEITKMFIHAEFVTSINELKSQISVEKSKGENDRDNEWIVCMEEVINIMIADYPKIMGKEYVE